MAFHQSTCFLSSRYHHQLCRVSVGLIKIERPKSSLKTSYRTCINSELLSQSVSSTFLGGSSALPNSIFRSAITSRGRKSPTVSNLWISNSEIASTAFTLGTVAVLPFYAFMIVAPRAPITKKLVESSIPYVLLGILYAYLLCLSWRPDTFHLMFASKYWLPELTGIARLFSSDMTLASAWIHLLVVDLYAARQVYHEGLKNNIETRHSVSLCLLFCPIGIFSHSITKTMTRRRA